MKKHVALIAGLAASLLVCAPALSASAAQSAEEFEVLSLTLNNGVATDSQDINSDDSAFVAINGDDLLNTGDDGVATFAGLSTLTAPGAVNNLTIEDGTFLFTDLKTQTAKMFERTFEDTYMFTLTGIITVDSAGDPVGSTVSLSEDISFDMNEESDCVMIGNGYDRVALWNICSGVVKDINISTGDVTTLTNQATGADYPNLGPVFDYYETNFELGSSFAASGIVEYVGGELRFVLAGVDNYDDDSIVGIFRYVPSAPATAPESVLMFADGSSVDLYNFTASVVTNQWCGHTEEDELLPEMAGMREPVFCADASYSRSPAPVPNPNPELANTGVDFSGMGIAGIAALGVVAAGAILLSRRHGVTK